MQGKFFLGASQIHHTVEYTVKYIPEPLYLCYAVVDYRGGLAPD